MMLGACVRVSHTKTAMGRQAAHWRRRAGGRAAAPLFALLLMVCVMGARPVSLAAAPPRANLWRFWDKSDEDNDEQISHAEWDGFLARYLFQCAGVSGVVCVDYGAVSTANRAMLRRYIARLADTPVRSLSRAEQRAFWINLYNALTVEVVLEHYPIKSIKQIPSRILSFGPWDNNLITIERQAVTLNDIEHRILRPLWRDPRIHYAVNCASIGCPNLGPRAFTADNSEELLDSAARDFINHPRAVSVGRAGRLRVSSIYHWFATDFGLTSREIIIHLIGYAEPKLAAQLTNMSRITSHGYDWSLNDAR